jgi:hypothetical protein
MNDREGMMTEQIYIKGRTFYAKGEIDVATRSVTIFKGSVINPAKTDVYGEYTTNLKQTLINKGILVNNEFTEDFTFDYPATASALVSGSRAGYKIIKLISDDKSIRTLFSEWRK